MTHRQIGCRRTEPGGLPVLEAAPKRRTVSAARFAVFFTVAAWLVFVVDQVGNTVGRPLTPARLAQSLTYVSLVTLLTGSALAYLVARLGHFYRARDHRRVPRAVIDELFTRRQPSMTVLVPSYREEPRVIRQTLLSAALQEYPDMDVVLLVDDPPNPTDPQHVELLEAARAMPIEIEAQLSKQLRRHQAALDAFLAAAGTSSSAQDEELTALADEYRAARTWIDARRREFRNDPEGDHTDQFMSLEVLGRLSGDLRATVDALHAVATDPTAQLSRHRAEQLHRRLTWMFSTRLSSFERKSFVSLSHEANKAMNLNTYIGLMGGRYRIETSTSGTVLVDADESPLMPSTTIRTEDSIEVREPEYILTLDADSTLLPEYCLRLVHFLEQEENAGIGVVQTPYSSYQGAATRIERISGATTDIQHLVHQGLTHYGATFWVGANAVLRKTAVDDLHEVEIERGFEVDRYIADRTVIEDTESSVDLRRMGWQLANYPERLSYSATPPDFGALIVQRKRWANGGLVILPKMLRLVRERTGPDRPSLMELFLRTNYLASIFWSSFGLLVLLFYPFEQQLLSAFAVVTALPYFVAMTTDLKRIGYKLTDITRLYGFNLLLLPVNLVGALQSVGQAIGGQKLDFARTPKVKGRTVAQLAFVVTPIVVLAWSLLTLLRDYVQGNHARAVFAAVNLVGLTYAFLAFIGPRAALVDIVVGLKEKVMIPKKRPTAPVDDVPHWASVLYLGSAVPEDLDRSAPLAVGLAAADHELATRPTRSSAEHGRPVDAFAYDPTTALRRNEILGLDLVRDLQVADPAEHRPRSTDDRKRGGSDDPDGDRLDLWGTTPTPRRTDADADLGDAVDEVDPRALEIGS